MCRLHHKGCLQHKRGSKVRQDIYEKRGFKVRKPLQNMCDQRIRVATLCGKMKIDVPTSPQGVEKTKHRLRKELEHLRKSVFCFFDPLW